LCDHLLDQGLMVADLGPPQSNRRPRQPGKPCRALTSGLLREAFCLCGCEKDPTRWRATGFKEYLPCESDRRSVPPHAGTESLQKPQNAPTVNPCPATRVRHLGPATAALDPPVRRCPSCTRRSGSKRKLWTGHAETQKCLCSINRQSGTF
jgi:hypothetical protein